MTDKWPDMRLVIFFRAEGFYPLQLPVDDDLAKHAECNPGTLRIEDTKGNILWRPQETEGGVGTVRAVCRIS